MPTRRTPIDVLRTAIRESGLTHYRIGKDAGVKPDQVARFVSGDRDLRFATAAKIMEALGLELVSRKHTK